MKSPLVRRKTHEAEVARLKQEIVVARAGENQMIRDHVRAWCREMAYNLFQVSGGDLAGRVRAALMNPDAIINFTPPKSDYQPIKPLPSNLQGRLGSFSGGN